MQERTLNQVTHGAEGAGTDACGAGIDDDLAVLVDAFGWAGVRSRRFLADGLMNRNWRIEIGDGTFALKQVIDVPLDRARRNLNVLVCLAAEGVPVCRPQLSVEGDLLVETGGRGYCVFPWAEGEHLPGADLSLSQATDLGVLLGRIHLGLSRLGPDGGLPLLPESLRSKVTSPETALAAADRFLAVISGLDSPWAFDLEAAEALERRKVLLEKYGAHRPADEVPRGPFGWTHGDFQYRNLLWRDGEVAAVLDWDRIGVRPYAEEVARTAQVQFGQDGRLDVDRVAAFVAGYRSVIGLGERDLADAVERLWWKRLTDYWVLEWHYDRGDHGCDDLWVSGEALLEWWTDHRSEAQSAFAARP